MTMIGNTDKVARAVMMCHALDEEEILENLRTMSNQTQSTNP